MSKDEDYKKYAVIRDELYDLSEKYDISDFVDALVDTLVSITEDDAPILVEESLEIHKELLLEEEVERKYTRNNMKLDD